MRVKQSAPRKAAGPVGQRHVKFGGKAPRAEHLPRVGKKRRYRPGERALRLIRMEQGKTDLILAKAPFQRLVRQVATEFYSEVRFQQSAMAALQEAAEAYLIGVFEDAQLCAVHGHRLTLQPKDVKLARRLRNEPQK